MSIGFWSFERQCPNWEYTGYPSNVRALIVRMVFGGILYHIYNKEPPTIVLVII